MAITKREFLKYVKRMIAETLCARGFHKHAVGIYSLGLDDHSSGWLGLNNTTTRGEFDLEINPVIGAYHEELELLLYQSTEFEKSRIPVAHICMPIGYLMPENRFLMWRFEHGEDNEEIAESMIGAIEQYGVPFMRANSTLENMCETMLEGIYGHRHQLDFTTPAALYLLGRYEEALDYAQVRMTEREGTGGEYKDGYRRFFDYLKAEIERDSLKQ